MELDNIANMTQGDLRRFITHLIASDPAVLPKLPEPDDTFAYGRYLGSRATLPSNALDGDVFDLIADATKGITWRLLYRATSASTYKWEYIGGPPLSHRIDTQQGTSSSSYTDLGTVGPQVVVPYIGEYRLQFGTRVDRVSADGWGEAAPKLGESAVDNNGAVTAHVTTLNNFVHTSRSVPVTELGTDSTPGRTVKVQYITSGVTVNFQRRWLEVTPIRIALAIAGGGEGG
jgi:hypothetical protein